MAAAGPLKADLKLGEEKTFAEQAVKRGFCTPEQIEEAATIWKRLAGKGQKKKLASILVDIGVLSDKQIAELEKAGPGPRTIDDFEIIDKIGQGGMGAVFKARQVSMDRIVALKILPKKKAEQEEFRKRFLQEAHATAKLSHGNIVSGIKCGEADGYGFLAIEFVDGESVRDIITKKSKVPLEQAFNIIRQMADALKYASQRGLIHRDIKPDNIMLTSDGTAKLLDLGLAKKQVTTNKQSAALTMAGKVVGTPHYIAPEQAKGVEELDVRADIYSLGATFYHMLTGKTPFGGDDALVIMTQHVTAEPKKVRELNSEIPEEWEEIICKMMAKKRDQRYANPDELIAALDGVGQEQKAATTRSARPVRGKRGRRRRGISKTRARAIPPGSVPVPGAAEEEEPQKADEEAPASGPSDEKSEDEAVEEVKPTTSAREPVSSATTTRAQARRRSRRPAGSGPSEGGDQTKYIVFGIGGVVVLVILMVMMSSGSGTTTKKSRKKKPRTVAAWSSKADSGNAKKTSVAKTKSTKSSSGSSNPKHSSQKTVDGKKTVGVDPTKKATTDAVVEPPPLESDQPGEDPVDLAAGPDVKPEPPTGKKDQENEIDPAAQGTEPPDKAGKPDQNSTDTVVAIAPKVEPPVDEPKKPEPKPEPVVESKKPEPKPEPVVEPKKPVPEPEPVENPKTPKPETAKKDKKAEEEKEAKKKKLLAAFKKAGWPTLTGSWEENPKRRGVYFVKDGQMEAPHNDAAISAVVGLKPASKIHIWVRFQDPLAQPPTMPGREISKGYGVTLESNGAKAWGPGTAGFPAQDDNNQPVFMVTTTPIVARKWKVRNAVQRITIVVKENDLMVQMGANVYKDNRPLQTPGKIVIAVEGEGIIYNIPQIRKY